jgi:hypothetical protein
MASTTRLALTLPDEQALPALAITPARSRFITWICEAKPSRPAKHRV